MTINEQDMIEAFDRIARTGDGQIAYRYFQKVLMGFLDDADPSPGALRENNARRKFASELMGLMSKGIEESGRSSTAASERPVVIVRRSATAVNARVNARDFLLANDPELAAGGRA